MNPTCDLGHAVARYEPANDDAPWRLPRLTLITTTTPAQIITLTGAEITTLAQFLQAWLVPMPEPVEIRDGDTAPPEDQPHIDPKPGVVHNVEYFHRDNVLANLANAVLCGAFPPFKERNTP